MNSEGENVAGTIKAWWLSSIGDRQSSAARTLRARLRRATPIEALMERPVFLLAQQLGLTDSVRIYRIARVLAEVEADNARTLMQVLGAGDPPLLSESRFQRLMRAEGEDLTTALVRAVSIADHSGNVAALGSDLFYWSDRVRTCWAFHYFGAASPETAKEISE